MSGAFLNKLEIGPVAIPRIQETEIFLSKERENHRVNKHELHLKGRRSGNPRFQCLSSF